MDVLLLASSAAGGAERAAVETVVDRLRVAGAGVEVVRTTTPADLIGALDRRSGRLPVVAGGDGSLHLLVAALLARDELAGTAVGLVPLGTGNDVARALGLPLDPAAAAAVLVHGRSRPLDLVVDDTGAIVLNAVHLGIGAVAARDGSRLKPVLGPLAYQVGGVLAGVRSRGWPLRVELDGVVVADRRLLQVGVGNGPSIGGGTALFPGARHDDGVLHVVTSADTGRVARAGYGRALRHGRHIERTAVQLRAGRNVTVSGAEVPSNTDGEIGVLAATRSWRIERAAWRLVARG